MARAGKVLEMISFLCPRVTHLDLSRSALEIRSICHGWLKVIQVYIIDEILGVPRLSVEPVRVGKSGIRRSLNVNLLLWLTQWVAFIQRPDFGQIIHESLKTWSPQRILREVVEVSGRCSPWKKPKLPLDFHDIEVYSLYVKIYWFYTF